MAFPELDPVAFRIFGFAVYWYALAYIAGILLGLRCALWANRHLAPPFSASDFEAFVNWAVVGILFGGRLGHMLYEPDVFLENPLHLFSIRQGGMSFHGGFLGVLIVAWVFSRQRNLCFWRFMDILAVAAPIGIFLGRLANFVNGELCGRPTDLPWSVLFPGETVPRHPSQVYEALAEGLFLWVVLCLFVRYKKPRTPGRLAGVFALGYGLMRILLEELRELDSSFNELIFKKLHITLGQFLSVPLVIVGAWLLLRRRTEKIPENMQCKE